MHYVASSAQGAQHTRRAVTWRRDTEQKGKTWERGTGRDTDRERQRMDGCYRTWQRAGTRRLGQRPCVRAPLHHTCVLRRRHHGVGRACRGGTPRPSTVVMVWQAYMCPICQTGWQRIRYQASPVRRLPLLAQSRTCTYRSDRCKSRGQPLADGPRGGRHRHI